MHARCSFQASLHSLENFHIEVVHDYKCRKLHIPSPSVFAQVGNVRFHAQATFMLYPFTESFVLENHGVVGE